MGPKWSYSKASAGTDPASPEDLRENVGQTSGNAWSARGTNNPDLSGRTRHVRLWPEADTSGQDALRRHWTQSGPDRAGQLGSGHDPKRTSHSYLTTSPRRARAVPAMALRTLGSHIRCPTVSNNSLGPSHPFVVLKALNLDSISAHAASFAGASRWLRICKMGLAELRIKSR